MSSNQTALFACGKFIADGHRESPMNYDLQDLHLDPTSSGFKEDIEYLTARVQTDSGHRWTIRPADWALFDPDQDIPEGLPFARCSKWTDQDYVTKPEHGMMLFVLSGDQSKDGLRLNMRPATLEQIAATRAGQSVRGNPFAARDKSIQAAAETSEQDFLRKLTQTLLTYLRGHDAELAAEMQQAIQHSSRPGHHARLDLSTLALFCAKANITLIQLVNSMY